MPPNLSILVPKNSTKSNNTNNSNEFGSDPSSSLKKGKSNGLQSPYTRNNVNECKVPNDLNCADEGKLFGENGKYLHCGNKGFKVTKHVNDMHKKDIKSLINTMNSNNIYDLPRFLVLPSKNSIANCKDSNEMIRTQYVTDHVNGILLIDAYKKFKIVDFDSDNVMNVNDENEKNTISMEEIRGLKTQLQYVLRMLHSFGFYHNDVKPDNILLCEHDENVIINDKSGDIDTNTKWMIKLIDFDLLSTSANSGGTYACLEAFNSDGDECASKVIDQGFRI